jgi:hypothetical protein
VKFTPVDDATPQADAPATFSLSGKKPKTEAPIVESPHRDIIDAILEQPGKNLKSAHLGAFQPIMDAIIGVGENVAMGVSGVAAKGVSSAASLGLMGYDAAKGDKSEGNVGEFKRDFERQLTYEPRTPTGKNIQKYNPLQYPAQALDALGRLGDTDDPNASLPRKMIGAGFHETVNQLPNLAPGVLPPAMRAAGEGLRSGARNTMRSALKPSWEANKYGKAGEAIETMLDKGRNVTPGGVAKIQGRISELNDQVKDLVDKHPGAVNREAVASGLRAQLEDYSNQVNPKNDLASIQKAFEEFGETAPETMSIAKAQAMKQGTYKRLGENAYSGKLSPSDVAAQKDLARHLKDEIAKQVPEVRPLNAEESALLNVLSISERRVLMEANKNPIGLGVLTTNPLHLAAWMADRSGLFKSLAARMMNTSGNALIKWSDAMDKVLKTKLEGEPGLKLAKPGSPTPQLPGAPGITGKEPLPGWTTSAGVNGPQRFDYVPGLHNAGEFNPLPQGIPKPPGSEIPVHQPEPLGGAHPDWTTSAGAMPESPVQAIPGHTLYDKLRKDRTKPAELGMPSVELQEPPIADQHGFVSVTEAEKEALRHPATALAREKAMAKTTKLKAKKKGLEWPEIDGKEQRYREWKRKQGIEDD